MDASVATEDRLRAAEFEVYILRAALEGAIAGNRIIARQFERCEAGTILHWAWRQAASNTSHLQNSLARSREDFPLDRTPPATSDASDGAPKEVCPADAEPSRSGKS